MFSFALMRRDKGSRESTYGRGERKRPCLVKDLCFLLESPVMCTRHYKLQKDRQGLGFFLSLVASRITGILLWRLGDLVVYNLVWRALLGYTVIENL